MTDLSLMPPLGCENDVEGRFTIWPSGDSHGSRRVSAEAEMGATPQAEGLVRAWGPACFHTLAPTLQGSLPFQ